MNEIEANNPGLDDARHAEPARSDTPQVRTLLLTDLVDSTTLVERLGDGPAAELFRAHDRLVLELQQRWRGRLIDRSDGLLLLFERPVDALGFALDYNRGLRALGERPELQQRQIVLQARAGLHVGEVLTWRNSEAAVQAGAKPLEVEGLAKPLAGRLMTLARPGQILLSATAEPMARRSARELGERSEHLIWKSHGRWRLKGMPDAQELFEVGEPGFAPLRAPRQNHAKAWRDIPLWRRPAALAAEVLLLVGMGTGLWFITRPQPAIAFGERDWVVVGDLRNLTGQAVLDESLEQAFRISLEQSRYVNVLSDMKARDTLARMQRQPGTMLDRSIASEIALRDGVRAVILPTVSEVGGRVRVSAEVIDPHTQTTVYAESSDGVGVGSTLGSIDEVTAALRHKLGEALKTIEEDSAPLPRVATNNLDALRSYALGQQAYAIGNLSDALRFFQNATELDANFALAWIGQLRAYYADAQAPKAVAALRRAQALRARMPPREALYVDAWVSEYDNPSHTRDKWISLARLYPDFVAGQANAAIWLMAENRYAEALPYIARQRVPQNPVVALANDDLGEARLGLEEYAAAAKAFDQAGAMGLTSSFRRRARVEAAQRRFEGAARLLAKGRVEDRFFTFERIALAVDRAKWKDAKALSRQIDSAGRAADSFDRHAIRVAGATADWLSDDPERALRHSREVVRQALDRLSLTQDADSIENAVLAASAALLAQRMGNDSMSQEVTNALHARPKLRAHPVVFEFDTLLRAETKRRAGHPQSALTMLKPLVSGHERYETRVILMEAAAAAGSLPMALAQSRWLQRHRGLAYVQWGCNQCLQALNVADSNMAILREAELLAQSGKVKEAREALARFDALWPPEGLAKFLARRRAALLTRLDETMSAT